MNTQLSRERERERERELRREGGKSLLAYVKGVDPHLIHIDRPTTIRSPEHISGWVNSLSTYHSWFMTGDIPQEELEAGYPQGMPRYIRHTSGIPFTYVKQLMRFRTGAHHLAIETGRWARPKLPRQLRVCSKCSCTVVEDEVHFLFECPAYDRIREKYNTVLFAQFGGCQEASSTMKHNSDNVRLFMDQEPSFQVAKFVYECMEPYA